MAKVEIRSEISGSVWKIMVHVGDRVVEDDVMMILESMKMEIPLGAPEDGIVSAILVREGSSVAEGEIVAVIETGG